MSVKIIKHDNLHKMFEVRMSNFKKAYRAEKLTKFQFFLFTRKKNFVSEHFSFANKKVKIILIFQLSI